MPRRRPAFLAPGSNKFPDPRTADAEGLLAVGGDLAPERLLAAYRAGIFPWFDETTVPLWWSPDPRAVFTAASLHVARRLVRTMRRGHFTLTFDCDFAGVMTACGENRDDGTWITDAMLAGYCELHRRGHAHSLEVWCDGALAGGIYGVHVGGVFAAESMFHRVTDASKVALVAFATRLFAAGVELLEVQFVTPHLASLGAFALPRAAYLERLAALRDAPVDLGAAGPMPMPGRAGLTAE